MTDLPKRGLYEVRLLNFICYVVAPDVSKVYSVAREARIQQGITEESLLRLSEIKLLAEEGTIQPETDTLFVVE